MAKRQKHAKVEVSPSASEIKPAKGKLGIDMMPEGLDLLASIAKYESGANVRALIDP